MALIRSRLAPLFISLAILAIAALPQIAHAGYQAPLSYSDVCLASGYGQTTQWSSSITTVTVKQSSDGSCEYRGAQLAWFNGTDYTFTSWDNQFTQNAAIGVGVGTYGYSYHRIGWNTFYYTQTVSYSG